MSSPKIGSLEELAEIAASARAEGRTIVLCHGTFDLIHIGHIRHLQRAKQEGDCLFVTLTADAYVRKGPGRPVFDESLRLENLAALACVDHVALVEDVTALPAINAIKPQIYAKGSDYQKPDDDITGNIRRERDAVAAVGGRSFCTDEITFSSSHLLNEHFSVFPPEVKDYLRLFAERFTSTEVIEAIKGLQDLKVLVVGDAIVDQYHQTNILGQTGKGNIFAVRRTGSELFAGGALAVANHIAGYCNSVTLMSGLGRRNSFEAFIREKLSPNIEPIFFFREDAPTTLKTRFVDPDGQKLFEVYDFEETPPPETLAAELCSWLSRHLEAYDVVIAPDFGNGFITDAMADLLSRKSRYLAVNTQINSGNRGYHTINRYDRANFVSLNEPELRLAVHNRHGALEEVADMVASRVGAKHIATTLGTRGLVLRDVNQRMSYQVPALSLRVVDRVGAGDAFLSIAGICLGGGLAPEIAAFAGAAAAAIDVQIVCNREAVESSRLFKYMVTLLK